MSIFEKLKKDHDTVRKLLQKVEALIEKFPEFDEEKINKLVGNLNLELTAHNKAEEETLYNTLKAKDENKLLIFEAFQEHGLAMNFLSEFEEGFLERGVYAAKLKIFKELVLHHIEEEESKVFDYARECLTSEEQKKLAKEFDKKKNEILKEEF